MRRFFASFVAFAAILASSVIAQDVPLSLKGDVVVVKIDKIMVIKEDRTVVRSLPFTITAPQADDYRWSFPSGVVALEEGDGGVLKVTAAPKGEITISVRTMVIDYNAKITTRRTGSLTFNVGDVGPAPAPDPVKPIPVPDPPLTPLQKSLQAAFLLDNDREKAEYVLEFADLLQSVVAAAQKTGRMKTIRDFTTSTKAATDIALGNGDAKLGATRIPNVRAAVGAYLSSVLPRDAATPFDDSYVSSADAEHKRVAAALKGLK